MNTFLTQTSKNAKQMAFLLILLISLGSSKVFGAQKTETDLMWEVVYKGEWYYGRHLIKNMKVDSFDDLLKQKLLFQYLQYRVHLANGGEYPRELVYYFQQIDFLINSKLNPPEDEEEIGPK